jgi:hypothetical protein
VFKGWRREIKLKQAFFAVADRHQSLEEQRWLVFILKCAKLNSALGKV